MLEFRLPIVPQLIVMGPSCTTRPPAVEHLADLPDEPGAAQRPQKHCLSAPDGPSETGLPDPRLGAVLEYGGTRPPHGLRFGYGSPRESTADTCRIIRTGSEEAAPQDIVLLWVSVCQQTLNVYEKPREHFRGERVSRKITDVLLASRNAPGFRRKRGPTLCSKPAGPAKDEYLIYIGTRRAYWSHIQPFTQEQVLCARYAGLDVMRCRRRLLEHRLI